MKDCDKRNSHISSKLHVICISSYNDRHPLAKTFTTLHGLESLTTNHEVPGSIPGSTVGIFPEGEDFRGDHGRGRLVQFRFKGPPGTTSSHITTHIIGTT